MDRVLLWWAFGIFLVYSASAWWAYIDFDRLDNTFMANPSTWEYISSAFSIVIFVWWLKYIKGLIYEQIALVMLFSTSIIEISFSLIGIQEFTFTFIRALTISVFFISTCIFIFLKKQQRKEPVLGEQ